MYKAATSKPRGFTLLELMISMGILSIVGVLLFFALLSTREAVDVATTASVLDGNVRETVMLMNEELGQASKQSDDSLAPPLQPLEIVTNPAPNSPVEVDFQVPTSGSGRDWSRRIRYRYINEDTNNNALLDPGEDANQDGVLTRRIYRIEDINGDGDTTDPGEIRTLGTSNDLSDVQFALNDGVLTVKLTATKIVHGRKGHPMSATVKGRIYLSN